MRVERQVLRGRWRRARVSHCSVRRDSGGVPVIAQREVPNDDAETMRRVEAGETFVVTRNGAPVAELRPLPAGRRRTVPRDALVAAARRRAV